MMNEVLKKSIVLLDYAVIRVSGDQAETFLQGQLACDVTNIAEHTYKLGCYCNLSGRVFVSFWLMRDETDFIFLVDETLLDVLVNTLSKYGVFHQVGIKHDKDVQPYFIHSHQDNLTEQVDQTITAKIMKSDDLLTSYLNNMSQAFNSPLFDSASLDMAPLGMEEKGVNVILVDEQMAQSESFQRLALEPGTIELNQARRWFKSIWLRYGVVLTNKNTSEAWLPQQLNYHINGAVSFDKGCFLGQEVVARLHYRGELKTVLVQFVFSTEGQSEYVDIFKDYIQQNKEMTLVAIETLECLTLGLMNIKRDFYDNRMVLPVNETLCFKEVKDV